MKIIAKIFGKVLEYLNQESTQEAFLDTECVFRTVEGSFWYRIYLPYQKLLFFTPNVSENASRTPGGCPQSVESAISRAFENASRTVGGRFRYRIFLPYRRSLFFTPNVSENASRTRGGYFWYRIFLPYRRRLFPVPNFSN